MYFPPKRFQLFEFHDSSWFPSLIRDYITDVLQALWITDFLFITAPYKKAAEIISDALNKINKASETCRIVDLCSGAGGPNYEIARLLNRQTEKPRVVITLTDLFPNYKSLQLQKGTNPNVFYEKESVNALNCELEGFWTLYNSMHHFTENEAEQLLKNAVKNSRGVAVFEISERRVFCLLLSVFGVPIANLLYPLKFCRLPLTWTRVFFTYAFPVVPLICTIDGILSCLRTYSKEDYFSLAQKADPHDQFEWRFYRFWIGVFPLSAFVGLPKPTKS